MRVSCGNRLKMGLQLHGYASLSIWHIYCLIIAGIDVWLFDQQQKCHWRGRLIGRAGFLLWNAWYQETFRQTDNPGITGFVLNNHAR